MALSIVQSNTAVGAQSPAAVSVTLPSAVTAGHILVLAVLWVVRTGGTTGSTFTVADTGAGNGANTWSAVAASREAVATTNYIEAGIEFFKVDSCNGATAESVSVTPSQSLNIELTLWEVTAGSFFNASVGSGTAVSGGTAQSASLTPTQNGAVGLAACVHDDSGGVGNLGTAGAGYTLDLNGGGGNQEYATEHIAQATAAALTGAFTLPTAHGGPWVTNQIIFQPSAGPSNPAFVPQIIGGRNTYH